MIASLTTIGLLATKIMIIGFDSSFIIDDGDADTEFEIQSSAK